MLFDQCPKIQFLLLVGRSQTSAYCRHAVERCGDSFTGRLQQLVDLGPTFRHQVQCLLGDRRVGAFGDVAIRERRRFAFNAALEARNFLRERLKHLRGTAHDATFTIPQRFEGVRPVDRLGVLPRASRELLETLFHTRQCAKFLSQASDPRLQGNDLAGVGGQSGTDVIQPRLDLGNALGLEVVEQQELRRRAIGDAFDLVLAVDVGAKHASSLERDVRRLSIRSQDERLLTCRSADDVG